MITAHDFPSAHVADHAGMDMILVGDSLAMVALGMEDTSEVLMEEMLLHCKSVARATKSAFTVCMYLSVFSKHRIDIALGRRPAHGKL
jgi:3-methyl-2-oxobutanoate hydroxymethyltransferase